MLENLDVKKLNLSSNGLSKHEINKYFNGTDINIDFDISYYIRDVVFDENIFRKSFVIDLRKLSDDQVNFIFKYFDYFQTMFATEYVFQDFQTKKFNYRRNMEIIFIYDENKEYNFDQYNILYNMEYMFKRFMTESELNSYFSRSYTYARFNKFDVVRLKDNNFYMRDFNYIHGNNGSGKTVLLNKLSDKLKVPIFSMDERNINLLEYISNKDYMRKYIYMLTGSYEIGEYSDFEKYITYLSQVLEFSREHKNILLLDDLRWNSLDKRNKINLIDTLFEHSIDNESVVLTGCNDMQKGLIKSRVYKPNIIDL